MFRALEEIVKRGLIDVIKKEEIKVITASINDNDNNKFAEVLGCKYSDYVMLVAIQVGSKKVIDLMINDFGVNINEDIWYAPALFHAIRHEQLEMVEFLLQKGADVEKKSGSLGDTFLQLAIQMSGRDIIEVLINKGANINATNSEGVTALKVAAEVGDISIIQLLLDNGADMDSDALDAAAIEGHRDVVKFLLNRGANIEDRNGWDALVSAGIANHKDIFEMLLKHGADFNTERTFDGQSILQFLFGEIHSEENLEFAKFLVMHMVQMKCENEFVCEKNWLATEGHEELFKFQQDFEKELNAMKIVKFVNVEMCFYDVFKVKNDTKLLKLAKNENLKKVLQSDEFKVSFPIIHEIISKRFNNAIVGKELLDQLELFFLHLSRRNIDKLPKLARICIHTIASYLTVKDKKSVSSIVKCIAI